MNNIIKSCLVLCVISAVCVAALAYVNEITIGPIKEQEAKAETEAYERIFPGADSFNKGEVAPPAGDTINDITSAYKNGEKAGDIVKVTSKGYGGPIVMLVGIDNSGAISGVQIISHSETAGLGANCEKVWFTDRFKGKSQFPLIVVKSSTAKENEIDALTSATITTKAVADAVNAAHEWFEAEGGR